MPATAAQPAEATYADILALPEHVNGEIIDGELVVSPRPRSRHAVAASAMGMGVGSAFHRQPNGPDRPGGWWILDEPELHLGRHVIIPDLAGWRHANMPELPDVAFFTQAPNWVCEVMSPTSGRRDRIQKARIYAQHGLQWLWLVDPLQHTVEVLNLGSERHWQLVDTWGGPDDDARIPPFDAVALELSRWWMPLPDEGDR